MADGLIRVGEGTVRLRGSGGAGAARPTPPRARPLKYGKWRALALLSVYLLFGLHIAHWRLNGTTLAPLELNEVMYTLEAGIVTAGFLLMFTLFVATAVVGRFFCSWACHILALEDLCGWLLEKARIRVRPVRSRLLLVVPPLALFYMFVWPQILRLHQGRPAPRLRILTDEDGWASFITNDFWRNLPDPSIALLTFAVCGFAVVYFLGTRSFCFHACPYGAVFAAVDRLAPGRIKLSGHCEQCGICTSVCSSHVRVHEEIARFGKVVDTSCMKDLDCVSACPNEALRFGFTRPAPLASLSRTGRRRLAYDFSLSEELLMAAAFLSVLVVFRGLYVAIPFLMTLGLAGIVAYLSVLSVRLVTRSDVRLIPLRLKAAGKLTRAGVGFSIAMGAFALLFLHSAYIRYHEASGQRAFATVQAALEQPGGEVPIEAVRSAIDHLTAAWRWGLVRPQVRDHQLASLHLKSDDHAGAEPYLRRIVRVEPGDIDSRLALARLLAQAGKLEEAESEAEVALAGVGAAQPDGSSSRLVDSYALLGAIRAAREDREGAIESYRAASVADPGSASLNMRLGELLAAAGRYHEAAEHYARAATLEPGLAMAHFNRAAALDLSGDREAAIEAYRATLALLPGDVDTRMNLGFALARNGELAHAAEQFETLVESNPELARPHFNLARLQQQLGDFEAAQRHYRRAAELDPRYADAGPQAAARVDP